MKKTGLTRRIDELGRIVIPKEIRKNLKIRNSDELEIYVKDDTIILNKYAPINDDSIVNVLLNCISKKLGKNVLLTSKDTVIDCNLENKKNLSSLNLSDDIIKIIEERMPCISHNKTPICLMDEVDKVAYIIHPIVINGDLMGSLILYTDNGDINELDITIIEFSVSFLEKYLEK